MPSNVKLLAGASGGEPTDANFKNVTLLLHGDGSNGAQNNTFIDSSTNNFTITRNGNTTQGSFSPYGSNWSNYFDGTSDYLAYTGGSSLNFGTGDFTIELFVFLENTGTYSPFLRPDANTTTPEFGYDFSAGQLKFDQRNGPIVAVTTTMPTNQWAHVAVSRSGTSLRLFINGAQVGSTVTNSTNWTSPSGDIRIGGSSFSSTHNVKGYISNFRVLNGTALYTGSYTVPAAPLTAITNTSLLTCADNRFRDGSTNNFTITRNGDVKVTNFAPFAPSSAYSTSANGGSAYFDGSGDDLRLASNSAFSFGTGDFTIEGWCYLSSNTGAYRVIVSIPHSSGWLQVRFGGSTEYNSLFQVSVLTSAASNVYSTSVPQSSAVGRWMHFAFTRSGSTCRVFLDGVQQSLGTGTNPTSFPSSSFSDSTNISNNDTVSIGNDIPNSTFYIGNLSGVRILKGTAQYTANFTPPTSPPTAITNTSLLTNFTNAAIFDNSMKNDLETVGNAQISTSVKKFGTGSMYFDGSGDSVNIPDGPQIQLGSGNFTIEFWVYFNTLSGNKWVLGKGDAASASGSSISFPVNGVGTAFEFYYGSSSLAVTRPTFSTGIWYHVAVVRNGATITIYLNGTSSASGTLPSSGTALNTGGTNPLKIGEYAGGSIDGYVDEFRLTLGVARYTANFTAPTAPFPNK